MFTIVISEKGGAERRETFERSEISVGRVQGNDLMLPKGNVSKHHARLLFRDARFIVTDLKSTNGTYVNGRKISQATIVREGDKIYVGDFVLRVEAAGQAASGDDPSQPPSDGASARPSLSSSQDATVPPVAPAAAPSSPSLGGLAPMASATPAPGTVAPFTGRAPEGALVSHFPLERDPDSESAPELRGSAVPRVPGPPRLPQGSELRSGLPLITQPTGGAASIPARAQAVSSASFPRSEPKLLRETPAQMGRRLALTTLVDRVLERIDRTVLNRFVDVDSVTRDRIDATVREQARAMRSEGEVAEDADLESLASHALRELVGIGPLEAALEDDETTEIHIAQPQSAVATRNGKRELLDPSFTSEEAVRRALFRLAQKSGDPIRPGEEFVERRMPGGLHLLAIGPPTASGWVIAIRRVRSFELSLGDLVQKAALSSAMAAFLEASVQARANVLVVGSGAFAVAQILAALASATLPGERIAVLRDDAEIVVPNREIVSMAFSGDAANDERVVGATARMGGDRLVVMSLRGRVTAAAIDAIDQKGDGLLAGMAAPSLRHGLARLVAQIGLARPGTSIDAVREALGECIDIGIEAMTGSDGKVRVTRISEIVGAENKGVTARDLFVLSADSNGESSFAATGAMPRAGRDFAARGIRLDPKLFKG